ncbi:MAG TPA: hypothetical protein PKK06_06115 [Phycisphaerae bacterium]|nr:hypothetical protein [Phycisphaerae bacterium]HNU44231.1 hypothetical protein [Phycisphaerae bacterium]
MAFRDILATVLLSLGGLLLGASCRQRPPDLQVYDTPDWEGASRLLLRSSAPDSTDLLLRTLTEAERRSPDAAGSAPTDRVIYRYEPGADRLEPVGAAAWTAATGAICDSATQGAIDPLVFDYRTHTLTFQGRALTTGGAKVLTARTSPSGRYVAVLSAKRLRRNGLAPVSFSGVGDTVGWQYYHELFRRSDGTRVGRVVTLPKAMYMGGAIACWSCDERHVVYASDGKLCIVPANVKKGE